MSSSSNSVIISLIATVLNEYGSLPDWVDGLRSQTMPPDECVIVDGGSTDGTLDYLRAVQLPFPTKVIHAPGCTIAEGRNVAMEATTGDVVAITDAGTRADERWLEYLVAPFRRSNSVDIVAGVFMPDAESRWKQALAAATLPDIAEIDNVSFLPSSRSLAIRRRWIDNGFAYPEWLDYCEDLVFDLQLRRAGASQITEKRAVVSFAPRGTAVGFALQYFRYARGDGKAGLFAKRHLIRYASYAIAFIVVVRRRRFEMAALLFAGSVHFRKVLIRARRRGHIDFNDVAGGALFVALAASQMALGDLAKMAGYPTGLLWRARHDGTFKFWRSGWENRPKTGDLRRI
jgi:glycosyltransferase involved in cell wall biosynthesis